MAFGAKGLAVESFLLLYINIEDKRFYYIIGFRQSSKDRQNKKKPVIRENIACMSLPVCGINKKPISNEIGASEILKIFHKSACFYVGGMLI